MAAPINNSLPQEGSRLGQYEIIRYAGAGGMGMVYLARDVDLERLVALKVLRPALAGTASDPNDQSSARFMREARLAASLNHPNTVSIYQVGRQDGLTYIAMEWVEGGSLSEYLSHRIFLEWQEATAAVRDAAIGLGAAHRAGLIHRDIKPANLMRTSDGLVKVVDFGLARLLDGPSDLTQSGSILGTPAYLSPEQCRGETATPLSDIYSLACTYFHLLTSRPPFENTGVFALVQSQLFDPFPDPRKIADEIPDAVVAILERASHKTAADRYPSCEAMLVDLNAVLAGQPVAHEHVGDEAVEEVAASAKVAVPPVVEILPKPLPTPNNLPHSATSFIGRQRELAEAKRLLKLHRLVTLIGPGGTGKTRLSLHVAESMLSDFPDGVWFVDLAKINDESMVHSTILDALGISANSQLSPLERLSSHIQCRHILIVLDNCEHVIETAAGVTASLLGKCERLVVLATSRQALGCAGEAEMRIPPLAAPIVGEILSPRELGEIESVRLFVDRAAQVRPGFEITLDNAAALASICRRLDGIPLAIELAAARVKVLSPTQISERLGQVFQLLTTGPRTALPRQRTLRALIDWSFDLLTEEEKTVFIRLGVYMGSFSLESAEQIAGGDGIDSLMVFDRVAELADKSLLHVDEQGGEARYRMLETIRHYAGEKLDQSGQRGAVELRHLEYFRALAEKALPQFTGPEQANWLRRIDREHDNIRAAIDRDPANTAALQLAAAMCKYWFMRGHVIDGLTRLEKVIDRHSENSPALARVLSGAGQLATYQGDRSKSKAYLTRALSMAQAIQNRVIETTVMNNLGVVYKETGDRAQARDLFEQVLARRRELVDPLGIANALNNLGILLAKQPEHHVEARKLLKESLTLHQQLGNASWVAYSKMNLAEIEYDCGNVGVARGGYAVAYRELEALGDEWGIAYTTEGLGKCDLLEGQLDSATRRFELTLSIVQKLGDKRAIADQLDNLAQVELRRRDTPSALLKIHESLSVRLAIEDEAGVAQSMDSLADALQETQPKVSAMLLGCADRIRRELGVSMIPVIKLSHKVLMEIVTAMLGKKTFTESYESGRSFDPKEALDMCKATQTN